MDDNTKGGMAMKAGVRYRNRKPDKVTPEVLAKMRQLRAAGKPYAVVGPLCGVSPACAQKWLQGKTPKRQAAP